MAKSTRAATLGVAALLFGCGPAVPAGTIVNMYDNQYSGSVTRVPVGTRVIFLNHGRSVHNATAADGSWRAGDVPAHTAGEGQGGEAVFAKPGVYRYYCTYHGTKDGGGMAGVVVVGDVPFSPSPRGAIAPVDQPTGKVLHVPGEFPTIQAGVDAAAPGDLVLVDRGTYREEVTVTTPSIVIRGLDRNEVVIDGEFVRGNGITVLADAVAVENMTARNALLNGFFWTGVTGFRGSFLTAYNNGDYGIYAFGSKDGVFEDSYASGSPDSGFYIGQCYPCRVVIQRVTSERNGLGYSGTNAGGQLYVVSSIWRNNRAGIVPASLDVELDPPQREAVFAANLVIDNNNRAAPAIAINSIALGNGILLGGTVRDTVERNLVVGHEGHGILAAPIQDRNYYGPIDNVIRDNRVSASGRADLGNSGPGASGNCFSGNHYQSSAPLGLQAMRGCQGLRSPWWSDWVPFVAILVRTMNLQESYPDWKSQPAPPRQPPLPDAATAPVRIARHPFDSLRFDLAAARLPAAADSVDLARGDGAAIGALRSLVANATLVAAALVGAWWIVRARRRTRPSRTPWRRRLGVVATGLGVVLVTLVASAVYYGRN